MSDNLRQRLNADVDFLIPDFVDRANAESPYDSHPASGSERLSRTLTWRDIPEWQRDNEYIVRGYRRVQNSWRGCAVSVFAYLHNETINIHSHLVGALIFVFLLWTFHGTYLPSYETTTWRDAFVFAIFLVAAVFCLTASAVFHAATCHSEKVSARCHAFDYAGIVVLTVGSFYPAIYYGFFCESRYQALWLGTITFAGLGAAYIVLNPEYSKPTHRGARTKVFIGLGLSAVAPVGQLVVTHGAAKLVEQGFGYLVLSGALYIVGALIYANRIPERLSPGKFDHFFASHQIFHVCVVLAALSHYVCVVTAFEHSHSVVEACSP